MNSINSLSIVIPTHNRPGKLLALLESIEQSLKSSKLQPEILVVDDGSDADPGEEIRSWLDEPDRFLIISPVAKGPSHARNTGVERSNPKSNWILLLDDDVVVDPQYFHHLQSLEPPDDCVGIEGFTQVESGQSPWVSHPARKDFFGGFGSGNILYKRADFLAVGGFDEVYFDPGSGVHFREDTDLGLRILDRGRIIEEKNLKALHGSGPKKDLSFLLRDARKYRFDPYFLKKNPQGRQWIGGAFRKGRLGTYQLRGWISDLVIISLFFSLLYPQILVSTAGFYLILSVLIFRDYSLGFYDVLRAALVLVPYPFVHSGFYWRGFLEFRLLGPVTPRGIHDSGRKGLRILHVVRQFWPTEGGMQGFVLSLSQRLMGLGHDIEVLTLDHALHYQAQFSPEETLATQTGSIKIHRIKAHGPAFFFWPYLPELDWERFDIVHVHGMDLFLERFTRLKHRGKLSCPLILSTHGGFFHSSRFRWIKKIWFHNLSPRALDTCDRVLASSAQDLELFKSIDESVELLENGVELKDLSVSGKIPNLASWLYVGGFQAHKQVPLLIEFFSQAYSSYPELRLTLVGEGPLRKQCEALVQAHGLEQVVCFAGTVEREDLVKLYHGAGLFLSAASYEGFGLAVVEAMAAGALLLLSDIEAFKAFTPNNDTGQRVDFSDLSSARRGFERLYELDGEVLRSMSERCTQISARFDWDTVSHEFENHYLTLVREKEH